GRNGSAGGKVGIKTLSHHVSFTCIHAHVRHSVTAPPHMHHVPSMTSLSFFLSHSVSKATMIAQWKEMFKTLSRVKCPSSDCWCEFPSVFSLKQHYERCQGVGLAFRLRFSCPSCEAVFVAKAQLQKHLVWNHSDRGGTQEQRSKQSAFDSGGKERCNGIPLKSTTLYKPKRGSPVFPSLSFSLFTHSITHFCLFKVLAVLLPVVMAPKLPVLFLFSISLESGRKQKTPKKFTGEQPSITGAFTLKGKQIKLCILRSKKKKGVICVWFLGGKDNAGFQVDTYSTHVSSLPGSMEDVCQKQIIKRGEVTCPNCVSITRKTMAGLRKHMEVCEQLQEALRCQHCRKQFKSKAGLNYHTMAEHMNKVGDTPLDEQKERERLRKVLKQMGKLRCAKQVPGYEKKIL
uniref:Zinc finger protein 512 n=1 Tax=Leptobrachium leishanense TaxID=445787 RepID=A0A8C5QRM6_9ANUR